MRRLMALLAVLIVLMAGLTVASPAQAAFSDCINYGGYVCMWRDANYSGTLWVRQVDNLSNGTCINLTGNENNQITSEYVNANVNIMFYTNVYCQGSQFYEYQQSSNANLTHQGINDQISSMQVFI